MGGEPEIRDNSARRDIRPDPTQLDPTRPDLTLRTPGVKSVGIPGVTRSSLFVSGLCELSRHTARLLITVTATGPGH